jgi:hypothetical protein
VPADLGREAFERADEHGELEIRGGNAVRGDLDAGPVEHRPPVDELGAPRLAEPRLALGEVGFELEQVAPERSLETCQGRLDTVGCATEGSLPAARRGRISIASRPALKEPAERER